ncbi:diguanylate cyclase (GGDEF)-like protein [Ilumatobacter fluminis]|uniref:Diguanylate cyclase (GGDEF)-like protein n=1 Tax=Ilumatobacter fluminis TaxID=467091 RepID=A0A4R7I0I4_9ACTN|nr:GGDEF domain-containing protein [Ilumatobacter fluminis]TDT16670.1 diguanylate cyclase (GGDEF)-like protein [Ilumatobacter fluminis]
MTTSSPASTSSFDVLAGSDSDPLLAAARATADAVDRDDYGVLVIVVRPNDDDVKVVSGGGTGVLRAAVSVAVAAGNDRVWRDAPHGDTAECPVSVLPEVITASADAAGVHVAHTGCVRRDGHLDAVAIFFESWRGVADIAERRRVLAELEHASLIAADQRQVAAERAAAAAPIVDVEPESDERTWDASDPRLDAVTGVLAADVFMEGFDDFEGDDATMIMLDLDHFQSVADEHGQDVSDAILRETADRLVRELSPTDVISRIGHDRFVVLLGDVARSDVMIVAKRLLAAVSTPLPSDGGPESVTATAALAYQDGLVDLEELYESAESAVVSGKRSGGGKLVLAA